MTTTIETVELTPEQRNERNKLAKAEAAALKAWEKAGSTGDRPATPNLDALNAQTAAGKKTKVKKESDKPAKKVMTDDEIRAAIALVWSEDPNVAPSGMPDAFRARGIRPGRKGVRALAKVMETETGTRHQKQRAATPKVKAQSDEDKAAVAAHNAAEAALAAAAEEFTTAPAAEVNPHPKPKATSKKRPTKTAA